MSGYPGGGYPTQVRRNLNLVILSLCQKNAVFHYFKGFAEIFFCFLEWWISRARLWCLSPSTIWLSSKLFCPFFPFFFQLFFLGSTSTVRLSWRRLSSKILLSILLFFVLNFNFLRVALLPRLNNLGILEVATTQ